MPSGHQLDGTWLCKPCNLSFTTWEALLRHKASMRQSGKGKHIHCKFCGEDFKTGAAEIKHIHQNHPQAQNLECPGCGMGPFVRLGGLMSHIERECPSLDVSVLEGMREKKLEFSRKLETLTHAPVKANYTNYMPSSHGGYDNADRATESKPDPFMFEKNQFPKLSAPAPAPGPSSDKDDKGKGKTPEAWGQGKNLFPSAPPAQRPTRDQLQAATSPSPRQRFECLDLNHPDHPSFNVARCYSAYTDKYGCPVVGCGKVFKKPGGLIGHLKSTAHSETKYRCPYCLDIFRSLAAITQHAESNGSKCRIRDTDTYDAYLDQLTAGMVDVSLERNEDGTLKYEMSKSFRRGDPDPKSKANGGDPWEGTDIQW